MDDTGDSQVATSSNAVDLNETEPNKDSAGPKKKKKKRTVKKKRKVVKPAPLADGVDQAPVNPDDLGPNGEHEEGYQTYDLVLAHYYTHLHSRAEN